MIAKYLNYFKQSLDERMKTLSDKHNPKCHCYKPHVFTIKSKQILTYMKFISISNLSFEEKK